MAKHLSLTLGAFTVLLLASCATILSGSKAKVSVRNDEVKVPVTLRYDNKVERDVFLPYEIKLKRGFNSSTITATADGYEEGRVVVEKKFNSTTLWNILGFGIFGAGVDAVTGAIMKPESKDIHIPLKPQKYTVEPMFETPAMSERVTRDDIGQTSIERIVVRWYFDSDPQGARIFWRVISNIPEEVKNTNELWLGSTPFEETRAFNIQGLTYENSQNVQIEIKVKRKGYIDQNKRFNVRQALDQQEISSFFEMIHE